MLEDYKLLVDLVLLKLSQGLLVDTKHIAGEVGTYRVRVGKYRLLFTAIEDTLLIQKILPNAQTQSHPLKRQIPIRKSNV